MGEPLPLTPDEIEVVARNAAISPAKVEMIVRVTLVALRRQQGERVVISPEGQTYRQPRPRVRRKGRADRPADG